MVYTETPVDNRIKERLTGALILVAALVILVPEMLSGPDKAGTVGDVPPARPATEGPPLRSYTLDLDAPPDKNTTAQSTLNVRSAGVDKPASPEAAATQSVAPTLVTAPAAPPRAAASESAAVPAAAPAAVPAATAPAVAGPPAAAGGWQVQVGSFAQRVNAQRFAQELVAKGFKAQVSSSGSKNRELFRVRVGPVADRAAATALQARLAAQGYRGSLAAP